MALADAYRRALMALLPPSKMWRRDVEGILSEIFMASGDELERVDARGVDLLNEADPRTTEELLPEWEEMLSLVASGSVAARQALVTAMMVRRQRVRPVDFKQALAPIYGLAPADVVILETSRATALAMGDEREIYRFFVYRDPSLPGDYDIDAAQAMIDRMAHSHTKGHAIESVAFKCDDPFSLCDRDLLGA